MDGLVVGSGLDTPFALAMTHQVSSRYLSESQVFDHFLVF